ncbi:hypothetical protein EAH78_18225 [Pseudomonas arsenicoxydans]|uniref:Uncharacterized protein n=1 Tax=Pseudomonas arsenicoxydans TaxID=702115 RepID=A0A502HNR6_9PSED|nr:hypothetical protein EAH78_18225 [Pseudomonas arsenicoxydans]
MWIKGSLMRIKCLLRSFCQLNDRFQTWLRNIQAAVKIRQLHLLATDLLFSGIQSRFMICQFVALIGDCVFRSLEPLINRSGFGLFRFRVIEGSEIPVDFGVEQFAAFLLAIN